MLSVTAAGGLFRVFVGLAWAGPVVVVLATATAAMWLQRRRRRLWRVVSGFLAVVVTVIWTVFPSSTFLGLPTLSTLHVLRLALRSIGPSFALSVPPVHPTSGLELLVAGGGGIMAVAAHWISSYRSTGIAAVFPSLVVFIAAIPAGRGPGRITVVAGYCVGVCIYLFVTSLESEPRLWFADVHSRRRGSRLSSAGATTLAAVAIAAAVTASLPGVDGVGVLGWRSASGGSGQRIVPNPLISLQTRLLQESSTPVFQVRSTVASYWQLTTLSTFDGTTWSSHGSYSGFTSQLPGIPKASGAVQVYQATFDIQNLDSVWLPDQFNPVSVNGTKGVSYDPQSDSLLVDGSTSNGMTYTVTSYRYLTDLTATELKAAPKLQSSLTLSADSALPASVPRSVKDLADQITAGSTSEYAKALAIQNFLTGPSFSYTLNPPTDGSGTSALTTFLFDTKAGYCQQFAAAFAVLAREVGIPTRLGVGFATGNATPGGFQVLDSDAHTWPEVYFGPHYGWVPFEPTPGFAVPGAGAYDPSSPTSAQGPQQTQSPVAPASPLNTVPAGHFKAGASQGSASNVAQGAPLQTGSGQSHGWGWVVLLVILGALVSWCVAVAASRAALRLFRRVRATRHGPRSVALDAWREAEAELVWYGISRSSSETPREFSRRVSRLDTLGGLADLAVVADQASFAPVFDSTLARTAAELSQRTRRSLLGAQSRTQRNWRRLGVRPSTLVTVTTALRQIRLDWGRKARMRD